MSYALRLQPDLIRHSLSEKRWAVYLWCIWGCVLALIVGWVDRSPAEAVVCVVAGVIMAFLGMPLMMALWGLLLRNRLTVDFDAEGDSYSAWYVNKIIADQHHSMWDVYPAIVVVCAAFHGMLAGPIVGAIAPVTDGYPITAAQGALLGAVAGPLFVGSLCALLFPFLILTTRRPAAIDQIKPLLIATADEAKAPYGFMSHEHLLLAVVREPSGAVLQMLQELGIDRQQLVDYMASAMPERPAFDEDDTFPAGAWYNIVSKSRELAKQQRREQVDPGHLLLALMDAWPELTGNMFSAAGFDGTMIRERLIAVLSQRSIKSS